MPRPLPWLVLLALPACDGCGADPDDSDVMDSPHHWEARERLASGATAFTALDGTVLWADGDGVWIREEGGEPTLREDLPSGPVHFLGAIPGEPTRWLAWVEGRGLYRDAGAGWRPVAEPPASSLLGLLSPRALTVPFGIGADPAQPDRAWLAASGGLFTTEDGGDTWRQAIIDEGFNLLFTDVALRGERVVATAFRPAGILPAAYQDLLTAHVFVSEDGGASWEDGDPELSFRYPAAVALGEDGRAWIAAMDGGLFEESGEGWRSLGGPSDAVDVAVDDHGVSLLSATRGPWRLQAGAWTAAPDQDQEGLEPMLALQEGWALAEGGTLYGLAEGEGEAAPDPAGATVHVALSFHVNLYHSYRGDSNDDDGYGIDLDVMRAELDWLDARPELHADWDIENHFSLDGWMATDGADVLARIQERVASDQDGVRLMSWNNGAVSAQSREELEASIAWAQDSLVAAFGGYDPGVQPQECMFTQEHIGWYRDLGVEWITLFNSATPFTALRPEGTVSPEAAYSPITITAEDGESMTLVPAYHHGDLIDHGGLAGWVRQIHEAWEGDQLLLVHFDADAESWEVFDRELDAVMDLDFVRFTTLQDYLDGHPPAHSAPAPHDVADGTGDGWQSWAEKSFNHEMATSVAIARELAVHAEALGGDDPEVRALLDEALEPRLLALSTTNFGLAAPWLHEDRQQSARAFASEALDLSTEALQTAAALEPLEPGAIRVINTLELGGTALVELEILLPTEDWAGLDGLHILDEQGEELPITVGLREKTDERVRFGVSLVLELEALEERNLSWSYDTGIEPAVGGASADAAADIPLAVPFTECSGARSEAELSAGSDATVDPRGLMTSIQEDYRLALCDGEGTLTLVRRAYEGLPGVVLDVNGIMGSASAPEEAESVALSPLLCEHGAQSIDWRSFGGALHSRPVRQDQWSWNGQAVDGWVSLGCIDQEPIQVAHRVSRRSSLAFAPLRTVDGQALLAPLGTLWGDPPRHDTRATGGHGMGDVAVGIIGSQFHPAAPDWSGQGVGYRLLVGSDIDEGTLDLFAHPPLVRVGGATE
jgi:hypothetical protein